MARARNWSVANRRRRAHQHGTLPSAWGAKVARRTVAPLPRAVTPLPYDEVLRRLMARGVRQ
jgi:hypothetical protein